MDYMGRLGGGTPTKMAFQIGVSITRIGIPFMQNASNVAGIVIGTTTNTDNMVGCNLDTATYQTAQQTDGTSPERKVNLIVNPDAIWKARLSGGAASGTALTLQAITSAQTNGLTVTVAAGVDFTSPETDEGVVWGYDGVNAGRQRKIASTAATVITVTVAFDGNGAIGDNYITAPATLLSTNTLTLTTELTEVRADVAVAANTCAIRVLAIEAKSLADDGRTKSFLRLMSGNHALGGVLI